MDDLPLIIDKYADDVLRGCVHYLGNLEDAEKAFEEVFVIAYTNKLLKSKNNILPDLLHITRKVCLADTIKDDEELDFLTSFYGLSVLEAKYVIGRSSAHATYKVAY